MTAKRVTSAKRVNEDRKAFKAPPVWRAQKDPKVSKVHVVRLDHQVQQEKKENWVYPVSLDILARLARRETKAHLDGLAHPATKEIEETLELRENVENRVREVSEDLAVVRANKALRDPKVTPDNPAHQEQSESGVYQVLRESAVLLDNRVFLVFTARME